MKDHVNRLPLRSKLSAKESIRRIVRASSIRKYTGVIMNYVQATTRALESEGIQASKRSHAAKDYFEQCLSRKQVRMPKRGKYRKLLPLLRILGECLENNDIVGIRTLMTVMRLHELSIPNDKFVNSELVQFIDDHAGEILFRSDDVTAAVPEDVYTRDTRSPLRIVHDEMQHFPDFPWQEFRDWLAEHVEDDWALARECAGTPPLSASIFSKSSASNFIRTTKDGSKHLKSATGSGVADLELAVRLMRYDGTYYHNGCAGNMDPAIALGQELIKFFELDDSYSYTEHREIIKNEDGLRAYIEENFRYSSITSVAIEASRDWKARIIQKTGYPLNYPLQWLHEILMRILRRIPGSYAHNHDAGFESMNAYAGNAPYLGGVDAKSWTDWFPLAFQFFVLANYVGVKVACCWVLLMREPIKVILTYPDGRQELIVYRVFPGQTMGSLSSWATATVSHNKLLRFSYSRTLKDPYVAVKNRVYFSALRTKHPYWIVGDDEQCSNPDVQADYLLLSELLGVRMSAQKCTTMVPEQGTYLAEFVHRQSLAGVEVTGLSPILSIEAFASYDRLVGFLQYSRQHGFQLNEDQLLTDLRKDTKSLTRKDYIRKHGCKPIPARWIDIGLRIPSSLGGLRSNQLNWNSYVEPDFALSVMVARITSTVSVYRSLAKRNREFTRNNEDKILNDLSLLPDHLLNIGESTVARYLRKEFATKTNSRAIRHTANLIDTFLERIQPILEMAAISNYELVDLEAMRTFVQDSLEELQSIVGVPTYLAAEAERLVTRSTMTRLSKIVPGPDRMAWSNRLIKRLVDLKRSVQDHGWVFIEHRSKRTDREHEAFYADLFSKLSD